MKTAKFGFISLAIALLLFVVSYSLPYGEQTALKARLSLVSFVFMVAGLGLITFDKRWLKERHEIENEDDS